MGSGGGGSDRMIVRERESASGGGCLRGVLGSPCASTAPRAGGQARREGVAETDARRGVQGRAAGWVLRSVRTFPGSSGMAGSRCTHARANTAGQRLDSRLSRGVVAWLRWRWGPGETQGQARAERDGQASKAGMLDGEAGGTTRLARSGGGGRGGEGRGSCELCKLAGLLGGKAVEEGRRRECC